VASVRNTMKCIESSQAQRDHTGFKPLNLFRPWSYRTVIASNSVNLDFD
jgi:hypothetical protein